MQIVVGEELLQAGGALIGLGFAGLGMLLTSTGARLRTPPRPL
ncbi:hypothetical protein ACF1AX_36215 [Streptomyces sp. NPDC014802]